MGLSSAILMIETKSDLNEIKGAIDYLIEDRKLRLLICESARSIAYLY